VEELNEGRVQYAYVRVVDPKTQLHKFVFVSWLGDGAPQQRKAQTANHLGDVQKFFSGAHVVIHARSAADLDTKTVMKKVEQSSGAHYSVHKEQPKAEKEAAPAKTGTNYQRAEILHGNIASRDKFGGKSQAEIAAETQRVIDEKRAEREAADARQRTEEEKRRAAAAAAAAAATEETAVGTNYKKAEIIRGNAGTARAAFEGRSKDANEAETQRIIQEARAARFGGNSADAAPAPAPAPARTITAPAPAAARVVAAAPAKTPAPVRQPEPEPEPEPEYEPEPEPEHEEPEPEPEHEEPEPEPEPEHEEQAAAPEGGLQARALFSYDAGGDDEISFAEGDLITSVEQIDDGWWQGMSPSGAFGLFPANYVELV
jgi:drebrin-like protein